MLARKMRHNARQSDNISIALILYEYDQMRFTILEEVKSTLPKSLLQSLFTNQMLVFDERGKPEYQEENLSWQSRELTNSIIYDTECANRTRASLVESKCSHHYANPATLMRLD